MGTAVGKLIAKATAAHAHAIEIDLIFFTAGPPPVSGAILPADDFRNPYNLSERIKDPGLLLMPQ